MLPPILNWPSKVHKLAILLSHELVDIVVAHNQRRHLCCCILQVYLVDLGFCILNFLCFVWWRILLRILLTSLLLLCSFHSHKMVPCSVPWHFFVPWVPFGSTALFPRKSSSYFCLFVEVLMVYWFLVFGIFHDSRLKFLHPYYFQWGWRHRVFEMNLISQIQ